MKKGKDFDTSTWLKFKNEFWVFFITFLFLDISSITTTFMLVKKLDGWMIFSIIKTTIIPLFVAGSLFIIYKTKPEVVEKTVYLKKQIWIRVFSKKQRKIVVEYNTIKMPKAFKWLIWSIV